jgi:predicted dehydrogenase
MTPVTIALVGVQNHGRTILHAIREAGNLELALCCDVDEAALDEVHAETGVSVTASLAAVLESDAEAVALVTPNHLHAAQIAACLEAGKHVFVEKPIANTLADASACMAAAAKRKLTLMVGHNTRRRKVFRELKRIVDSGMLGRIVSIESNLSRHAGLEEGVPEWKLDPERCTLLPMTQLGIHFVDTLHYLFGPVREVYCRGWNGACSGGIVDSTIAMLTLDSGPVATIASSYVTLDEYSFRVFGANGTVACTHSVLTADLEGKPRAIELDFSGEGYESFILQMQEFGDCIRNVSAPETGGEEGYAALAVVEAMRASIASGGPVRMNG